MDEKKGRTNTFGGKVKISVNIPEQLLTELDECRKSAGQDRSIWVTSAILEKIYSIRKQRNANNYGISLKGVSEFNTKTR